jgi:hypothetical protein
LKPLDFKVFSLILAIFSCPAYGQKPVSLFHSLVAGGKPDMEATKLQLIRFKPVIVSLLTRIIGLFANTLFSAQPNTLLIPYNPEFRYNKSDQTTAHVIGSSLLIEPFSGISGGKIAVRIRCRKVKISVYTAA